MLVLVQGLGSGQRRAERDPGLGLGRGLGHLQDNAFTQGKRPRSVLRLQRHPLAWTPPDDEAGLQPASLGLPQGLMDYLSTQFSHCFHCRKRFFGPGDPVVVFRDIRTNDRCAHCIKVR